MTRALSNRFQLTIAPKQIGRPAWLDGLALFQWKRLPNTNLGQAKQPAWDAFGEGGGWKLVMHSWAGAAIDTRDSTIYSFCNGGHAIGPWNFGIKLKLSVDNPVMEEATYCSPAEAICSYINESGSRKACRVNNDGRPPSQHTYYNNQFSEKLNRSFLVCATALTPSGNYPSMSAWNPQTGDYDPDLTFPDFPLEAKPDSPTCTDPNSGRIYRWLANYGARAVFDPDTVSWRRPENTKFRATSAPIAVDTKRNRLFHPATLTTSGDKKPFIVDLETDNEFEVTLVGLGRIIGNPNIASQPTGNGWGMDYVPEMDAFLLRQDFGVPGGRVFAIDADTFEVSELQTTGGDEIPPARRPDGQTRPFRAYNKWLRVPAYGVMAYLPGGWDQDAWVLRVV